MESNKRWLTKEERDNLRSLATRPARNWGECSVVDEYVVDMLDDLDAADDEVRRLREALRDFVGRVVDGDEIPNSTWDDIRTLRIVDESGFIDDNDGGES